MAAGRNHLGLVGVLIAALVLGGCTETYMKRDTNYEKVTVERPDSEVAENQLLDVRIRSFEAGQMSEDADKSRGLSKEIRRAEGHFAAVQLKEKMQQTGYWGAVRVVPEQHPGDELRVTGKILESDGELLKLEVKVRDATGEEWFTREYEGIIDAAAYTAAEKNGDEPFGFLYVRISNDIALHRAAMDVAAVRKIRQVAELRFASAFAPDAFDGFLATDQADSVVDRIGFDRLWSALGDLAPSVDQDGTGNSANKAEAKSAIDPDARYQAIRLPAQDDPMVERVRRVRSREHLVVDALDQHYENLARRIRQAYTQWRAARLMEMNSIREVEERRNAKVRRAAAMAIVGILAGVAVAIICNNCGSTGGAVGGMIAAQAAIEGFSAAEQASADEKIHKAAKSSASLSPPMSSRSLSRSRAKQYSFRARPRRSSRNGAT